MRSARNGNPSDINCSIVLPSDTLAPSAARRFVRQSIGPSSPSDDDLELLVSEVVTNAVLYGGGTSVEVIVSTGGGRTRVGVVDQNPLSPFVVEPDPARPNGRGVFLVNQLASRWSIDSIPGDGKCVWFECVGCDRDAVTP